MSRRLFLACALFTLFGAHLAYKVLSAGELEQTALFYVGLPALIALTIVLTARPRHPVSGALAVTAIGLALAGPLLDEGVVCLLMAAPLFFGIAALIGAAVDGVRRSAERRGGGRHAMVLMVPLLVVACLEGVGGADYLPREARAEATTIVDTSPRELRAALDAEPDYDTPDSAFLRVIPFPEPLSARGSGLEEGDTRTVEFTPRTTLGLGSAPQPRTMHLEVVDSDLRADEGRVVFAVTRDTALSNWLTLHRAEAAWHETPHGTSLTWTLDYDRTFAPSWYWAPLQQYAMNRAAEHLSDTFA